LAGKGPFQREVDHDRISTGLIPYLKDPYKIKFFNPLTLTLSPFEQKSSRVLNQIYQLQQETYDLQGYQRGVYELSDYFKVDFSRINPSFSSISGNDSNVKLVAIYGQNRLSIFKNWGGSYQFT
jgi:hypothetical protein